MIQKSVLSVALILSILMGLLYGSGAPETESMDVKALMLMSPKKGSLRTKDLFGMPVIFTDKEKVKGKSPKRDIDVD